MKKTITWDELQQMLRKQGTLAPTEEIKEVTLIKPRALLIHTEAR